ncbi:uncharacterized protein MONOS_16113 [Monocercomonoides exilis]|uniref:uncharacterized protein n=1 Tax=Monocercomonoides exilis TaxID=2049356 RepID=UPI00355A5F8F|nr:hypothetical protein MONOS_16113 [Monocercomonoides exilis]|eukprot:MONOS_16113.1-p1 / transcript=MONOS_16113.1 / gene=MONOS_16113 / organism=Monocercomonoides_exilis_PA203 / gene_product=unspecified product / transcript_product=unspecified product / location=Mono_scaffold01511:5755-6024(-) / protein_length=90 / sequence_SO=supercontig / SO=protein_coding / is_pseudo=false
METAAVEMHGGKDCRKSDWARGCSVKDGKDCGEGAVGGGAEDGECGSVSSSDCTGCAGGARRGRGRRKVRQKGRQKGRRKGRRWKERWR